MDFWQSFEIVYSYIWDFLDSKMNFGVISISFLDVLIAGGICWVLGDIVKSIIYDLGD